MKYFMLITLYLSPAITITISKSERVNGKNGWYIPKFDYTFEWLDKDKAETYLEDLKKFEDRLFFNGVTFNLYTKRNPDEEQIIYPTKESINNSSYEIDNHTKIIIHGWRAGIDDPINHDIRDAWLSQDDYNIIFVEWVRANSIDYISSVLAVAGVGEQVAEFVDFLVENFNLNLKNLEIIGHSLGAHVAGYTAKNIISGTVQKIVGLDPALPLFNYKKPEKRLANTDAYYVESIQTNGGKLGFLQPIGKASFYPNGGKRQPSCGLDITGTCSHRRAIEYYCEAVKRNSFSSKKCHDYKSAVYNGDECTYASIRMGDTTNENKARGEFYVPVNSDTPYGMVFSDFELSRSKQNDFD